MFESIVSKITAVVVSTISTIATIRWTTNRNAWLAPAAILAVFLIW
jgi:hypothetical protein